MDVVLVVSRGVICIPTVRLPPRAGTHVEERHDTALYGTVRHVQDDENQMMTAGTGLRNSPAPGETSLVRRRTIQAPTDHDLRPGRYGCRGAVHCGTVRHCTAACPTPSADGGEVDIRMALVDLGTDASPRASRRSESAPRYCTALYRRVPILVPCAEDRDHHDSKASTWSWDSSQQSCSGRS